VKAGVQGVLVHVGPVLFKAATAIAILAARHQLPSSGFIEEQLDKFRCLFNPATARAIGVALPQSVIVRADRVPL